MQYTMQVCCLAGHPITLAQFYKNIMIFVKSLNWLQIQNKIWNLTCGMILHMYPETTFMHPCRMHAVQAKAPGRQGCICHSQICQRGWSISMTREPRWRILAGKLCVHHQCCSIITSFRILYILSQLTYLLSYSIATGSIIQAVFPTSNSSLFRCYRNHGFLQHA